MFNTRKSIRLRNKRAMTFVEILIAGLLMAVIFVLGWMVSSSFTGVKKVRNYENALFLANEAVEAVRSARFKELGNDKSKATNTLIADFNSGKNTYDKDPGGFVPEVTIGNVKYKRTISIEDVPSDNKDLESCLKMIRVNVSWKDGEDNAPVIFEVVTAHCESW